MNTDLEDKTLTVKSTNPAIRLTGKRVLAIDDSRHIRQFMSAILEREGAEVICVPTGMDGIATCRENVFDIIFLDIRMPEMDGYETLAKMRAAGINTPTVALSSEDSERVLQKSDDFDDFLSKPVEHQRLVAMISKHTLTVSPDRIL